MYYTDGFHAPDDPRHHGLRLVGWAYGDDVVDVDTFDFDTVPENPVYLTAPSPSSCSARSWFSYVLGALSAGRDETPRTIQHINRSLG